MKTKEEKLVKRARKFQVLIAEATRIEAEEDAKFKKEEAARKKAISTAKKRKKEIMEKISIAETEKITINDNLEELERAKEVATINLEEMEADKAANDKDLKELKNELDRLESVINPQVKTREQTLKEKLLNFLDENKKKEV